MRRCRRCPTCTYLAWSGSLPSMISLPLLGSANASIKSRCTSTSAGQVSRRPARSACSQLVPTNSCMRQASQTARCSPSPACRAHAQVRWLPRGTASGRPARRRRACACSPYRWLRGQATSLSSFCLAASRGTNSMARVGGRQPLPCGWASTNDGTGLDRVLPVLPAPRYPPVGGEPYLGGVLTFSLATGALVAGRTMAGCHRCSAPGAPPPDGARWESPHTRDAPAWAPGKLRSEHRQDDGLETDRGEWGEPDARTRRQHHLA
jgi:hypothetical protein